MDSAAFQKLVQNHAGAANFANPLNSNSTLKVIDISASTCDSTVNVTGSTNARKIIGGSGNDRLVFNSGGSAYTSFANTAVRYHFAADSTNDYLFYTICLCHRLCVLRRYS